MINTDQAMYIIYKENLDKFNVIKVKADKVKELDRKDLRLTVDNPEDLIVCRELYKQFKYKSTST